MAGSHHSGEHGLEQLSDRFGFNEAEKPIDGIKFAEHLDFSNQLGLY